MMPKPILTHWKDVLILTLLLIIGLFCIPFPMTEDKSPHFRNIAHAELSPSEEASLTGRLKEIQTDIEYNQSDIHKIELRVESNEMNFDKLQSDIWTLQSRVEKLEKIHRPTRPESTKNLN